MAKNNGMSANDPADFDVDSLRDEEREELADSLLRDYQSEDS